MNKVDQAAKRASIKPAGAGFEGLFLTYIMRAYTDARRKAVEDRACENAVQGAGTFPRIQMGSIPALNMPGKARPRFECPIE